MNLQTIIAKAEAARSKTDAHGRWCGLVWASKHAERLAEQHSARGERKAAMAAIELYASLKVEAAKIAEAHGLL